MVIIRSTSAGVIERATSSLEAEPRVLSRSVGDLEALRPAAGDGGAGMVNVRRGVVVGLVGLAPALEGPPCLLVEREGARALLRHELLVQLQGGVVAAGPALHGPSVGAVHREDVQLAQPLPQPESRRGGRLRPIVGRRRRHGHLHLAS